MANFGMGHPTLNPEGAAKASDDKKWYETSVTFNSKADCFNPAKLLAGSGTIASGKSGHKSGAYADAIYASSVKDLRMSSKLLPRKEIREKYKRMAIAGDVRGYEGVPFTKVNSSSGNLVNTGESSPAGSMGNCWYLRTDGVGDSPFSKTTPNTFFDLDTSSRKHYIVADDGTIQHVESAYTSSGFVFVVRKSTYSENPFQGWVGKTGIRLIYIDHISSHKQASPTWTDIIGSPANIAATFPQGVEGQWIPNLHTQSNFYPLSRKALGSSLVKESTDDSGVTWSAGTRTANTTFNRVELALVDPRVELWHYTTQAHFTSSDVNSKVLDLGGVFGTINYSMTEGNTLLISLVGKVGTGGGVTRYSHKNVEGYKVRADGAFNPNADTENMSHSVLNLSGSASTSAVKTLDYLSESNGVGKLMYAYKEMVWDTTLDNGVEFTNQLSSAGQTIGAGEYVHVTDGTFQGYYRTKITSVGYGALTDSRWSKNSDGELIWENAAVVFEVWDGNGFGDNNQFEITNNQATQTDDNGNTVLYGTASFNTQYFITEE